MRLQLLLPRVVPTEVRSPSECPYQDCTGEHFQLHQRVEKPLRDLRYPEV
jgi:hypothetical protein